jgi:hypothetical protein
VRGSFLAEFAGERSTRLGNALRELAQRPLAERAQSFLAYAVEPWTTGREHSPASDQPSGCMAKERGQSRCAGARIAERWLPGRNSPDDAPLFS